MLNFMVDPRLEQSEPFSKRAFQFFRGKLPLASFGTHAGLAVLLAYLLDLSGRHAGAERWFRCTQDSVETDLGLVPPSQQRLLALLETAGYIEIQHIGRSAPVRYLRANLDAIEHDMLAGSAHATS
jgi:hypothetical protein